MNILFLDIDGVLNNVMSIKPGKAWSHESWDPKCVALVKKMCKEHDLEIVVSSSWRCSWIRCIWFMGAAGLPCPIDRTPSLHGKSRGDEITAWLKENSQVKSYVILDDENDFTDLQKEHHIQTSFNTGLIEAQTKIVGAIITKGMG